MNLKQSLHSLLADNETAEVIKQLRSITVTPSATLAVPINAPKIVADTLHKIYSLPKKKSQKS